MWRAKCLATPPTRHQNKYWLKRLRGCWAFSGFIWTQIYMELNWINAKIWCTLLHLHFFMNNLHITQFLWHHQCNWLGCNSFAKWLKQIARKWSFFTGTWWYPPSSSLYPPVQSEFPVPPALFSCSPCARAGLKSVSFIGRRRALFDSDWPRLHRSNLLIPCCYNWRLESAGPYPGWR